MTSLKFKTWLVSVWEAALPDLLSELGNDTAVYRPIIPGSLMTVVVYKEKPVTKKYLERILKAAIEVKPYDYTMFLEVKSKYIQIKWKAAENAERFRKYYHPPS